LINYIIIPMIEMFSRTFHMEDYMQIAAGVEMLEISQVMMGKVDTIHPTLIWDKDITILIDTGYPGQLAKFHEAFEKAGLSMNTLNKVLITHQDLDHIGSLPSILQEYPQAIEVLANEIEIPYIQGEKRLLKLSPDAIEQAVNSLPKEVPDEWRKAFQSVLENPPKARVDRPLADGEELPLCGGITVIHTPGHTPGHISLYHRQSKTLIAADAMIIADGELMGPDPQYTADIDTAIQSLHKLIDYDIETVICYHGGVYRNNPNQRIAELANEY
jgi:glyoxylase-like metal-dependent hydrolase (beta-lactamase superfamily II)